MSGARASERFRPLVLTSVEPAKLDAGEFLIRFAAVEVSGLHGEILVDVHNRRRPERRVVASNSWGGVVVESVALGRRAAPT